MLTDHSNLLAAIKSKHSDSFKYVSEKASSLLEAAEEVPSDRSWKMTEDDWKDYGDVLVSEALFLCHKQSTEGPKIPRRARGGNIVTDGEGKTVLAKNPLHGRPYFTPTQVHYVLKRLEFNARQIGSAVSVARVSDVLLANHGTDWLRVHPPFKEGTANRYSLNFD
jgi:hypothetical protein